MSEEAIGSLSAEEQAYFSSRGEAEIKPEPAPQPEVVVDPEVEAELAEDDGDAAAQAAVEGQPEPKKLVPLAALTKERQGAKELKAKLAEFEKRDAVWQDRWNMVLQANEKQEPAKAADPEPDPNQDIFAHNAWLKRQLEGVQNTVASKANEDAKAQEAAVAEQKIWGRWESDSRAYMQENQDFGNAAKWLSDFRDKQLQALSVVDQQFADPRARNWQIEHELKQIVAGSAAQGKSSAQTIYEIATGYGYTPKQAEKTAEAAVAALEKTEQNIAASTSMSGAGGSRPQAALDAKAVADMNPDQFAAWLSKNGEKAFRKLAGG